MRESNAGAEARWATTAERAENVTDAGIGAGVRRYFLFQFPLILICACGAGFFLASFWPEIEGTFLRSWVYLGSVLAGLGVIVIGLIYGEKNIGPRVQPQGIGVTTGLEPAEVKHVRRQILGTKPVEVQHAALLRGAAIEIRGRLAKQLVLSPGLFIYFCGQVISRGISSALDIGVLVLLLGMGIVYLFLVRQFLQTGKFVHAMGSATVEQPIERT